MADISKRIKSPRRERGDKIVGSVRTTLKASDSGAVCGFDSAVAQTFALPPVNKSQKGVFFDFVIDTAATSGTGHGVSPDSNDKIYGVGLTAADNKDVYFATASDAVGNGFRLTSDGVDGYFLSQINGTIAREA
jgi:hypothetical protein